MSFTLCEIGTGASASSSNVRREKHSECQTRRSSKPPKGRPMALRSPTSGMMLLSQVRRCTIDSEVQGQEDLQHWLRRYTDGDRVI